MHPGIAWLPETIRF